MKCDNERNKEYVFQNYENDCSYLYTDCSSCFGYCCVALYFSASEGFPVNKNAGKPCPKLQADFRCGVHKNLSGLGFKGCLSYDCFGAGQKVAMITYGMRDWRKFPEHSKHMYDAFLIMRQMHEMLWYLTEALILKQASDLHNELVLKVKAIKDLSFLNPAELIQLNVEEHRNEVNILLRRVSELVRNKACSEKKTPAVFNKVLSRGKDLIGANLKGADLTGEDLRGALLIAANLNDADLSGADLIGADLRDTDIRGTDLSGCIFLTQSQINSARGNSKTRLPGRMIRPIHWLKD